MKRRRCCRHCGPVSLLASPADCSMQVLRSLPAKTMLRCTPTILLDEGIMLNACTCRLAMRQKLHSAPDSKAYAPWSFRVWAAGSAAFNIRSLMPRLLADAPKVMASHWAQLPGVTIGEHAGDSCAASGEAQAPNTFVPPLLLAQCRQL